MPCIPMYINTLHVRRLNIIEYRQETDLLERIQSQRRQTSAANFPSWASIFVYEENRHSISSQFICADGTGGTGTDDNRIPVNIGNFLEVMNRCVQLIDSHVLRLHSRSIRAG